jgi:hypothetical protein
MAAMNLARRAHNAVAISWGKMESGEDLHDDENSGQYDSLPKAVIGRRSRADKWRHRSCKKVLTFEFEYLAIENRG